MGTLSDFKVAEGLVVGGSDVHLTGSGAASISVDTVAGTDAVGQNLTISAGPGDGTGAGGIIDFQTAPAPGSGQGAGTVASRMSIAGAGTVTIGTVDINAGAIDATTIGATTRSTGDFTTMSARTVDIDEGNMQGVEIGATYTFTATITDNSALLTAVSYNPGSGAAALSVDNPFRPGMFISGGTGIATLAGGVTIDAVDVASNRIQVSDAPDWDENSLGTPQTGATFTVDPSKDARFQDVTVVGGDGALEFTNASSIKIKDNQAAALVIEEANTAYLTFSTSENAEEIIFAKDVDIGGGEIDGTVIGANERAAASVDSFVAASSNGKVTSKAMFNGATIGDVDTNVLVQIEGTFSDFDTGVFEDYDFTHVRLKSTISSDHLSSRTYPYVANVLSMVNTADAPHTGQGVAFSVGTGASGSTWSVGRQADSGASADVFQIGYNGNESGSGVHFDDVAGTYAKNPMAAANRVFTANYDGTLSTKLGGELRFPNRYQRTSVSATLTATDTAVVTVDDTTGFAAGDTVTRTSGLGAFGVGAVMIAAVIDATSFSMGSDIGTPVNHATADAIVFTVQGVVDRYAGFKSGTSVVSNGTYTLPVEKPASDKVLQSTSAGVLSWVEATGTISALNNQVVNRLVTIGATTTELDGEANATYNGSQLFLDYDTAVTTGVSVNPILKIDIDKSNLGVTADAATHSMTGMQIDMDDAATNHTGSATNMTGILIDIDSASAAGTVTNTGLDVDVTDGDNNYAAIFRNGRVGIGTATPSHKLEVSGASNAKPKLNLINTGDNTTGPELRFTLDKGAAGAANDIMGQVSFYGDDAAQNNAVLARMEGVVAAATSGSESGKLSFSVATTATGALAEVMSITGGHSADASTVSIIGNLLVEGETVTMNTHTLSVDDKHIELGAVGNVTGLQATLSGATSGTTVTLTAGDTTDLMPGMRLTETGTNTGEFGANAAVASITSDTEFEVTAGHAVDGAIVFSAGGPTDYSADGGGIILKATTDNSILWNNSNASGGNAASSWQFNRAINLPNTAHDYKIYGVSALSRIGATEKVWNRAFTGDDLFVVTGTAGSNNTFAKWDSNGDLIAAGAAPSGDPVGTSDIQTLSNKTLIQPKLQGNTVTFTANTHDVTDPTLLKSASSTVGLTPGMTVTGTGIPGSTTIVSVDSATQVTMSDSATAVGTGVTITATENWGVVFDAQETSFTGAAATTFYQYDGATYRTVKLLVQVTNDTAQREVHSTEMIVTYEGTDGPDGADLAAESANVYVVEFGSVYTSAAALGTFDAVANATTDNLVNVQFTPTTSDTFSMKVFATLLQDE